MMRSALLATTLGLAVAGCKIGPPPERVCAFKSYVVDPLTNIPNQPDELKALQDSILRPPADGSLKAASLLYLSGGSQNGAFGAGLLNQWQANRRAGAATGDSAKTVSPFTFITGISTGALQSSFALIDRTDLIVAGYNIEAESDVLQPFLKGGKESLQTVGGGITVARKGAVGDLVPLRDRLRQMLFPSGPKGIDVLDAVATRVQEIRGTDTARPVLLAGVVDVDHGRAEALDLGDMAIRYQTAMRNGQPEAAQQHRDCYIEALVASSSEPLAARPSFIDNRMYVDGGMRIGVFDSTMLSLIQRAESFKTTSLDAVQSYLIINGTQLTTPRCAKADTDSCPGGETDANASRKGARKSWTILDLALRSVGILVNSVYRLSEAAVQQNGDQQTIHSVTIDPIKSKEHAFRGQSCAAWRDEDIKSSKPLQFHPNEMRCLINYGQTVANDLSWTTCSTKPCPIDDLPPPMPTIRSRR